MKMKFISDYSNLPNSVSGIGTSDLIHEHPDKICAGCQESGGKVIDIIKDYTGKFTKIICDANNQGNHCSSVNIDSNICIIKLK